MARAVMLSQGIFHVVLAAVHRETDIVSAFWIGRGRRQAPFDRDERLKFEVLTVRLGRAMRMHWALAKSKGAARSFQGALDRLEQGVALVDRELRIAYANPALEQILQADRGLTRCFDRLRASDSVAQRALEAMSRRLTDPQGNYQGGTVEVSGQIGRPRYTLTAAPALGDAPSTLASVARVIVFVTDKSRANVDPSADHLQQRFTLSPPRPVSRPWRLEPGGQRRLPTPSG